jgi:hypothetical protein
LEERDPAPRAGEVVGDRDDDLFGHSPYYVAIDGPDFELAVRVTQPGLAEGARSPDDISVLFDEANDVALNVDVLGR